MASNRTCPECHLIFEAELPGNGVLVCPLCNNTFSTSPQANSVPIATPLPVASGKQVLRGVVAVGAVHFLAVSLAYAYYLMGGVGSKTAALPAPTERLLPQTETPQSARIGPIDPVEREPREAIRIPKQLPRLPERQPIPLAEQKIRPSIQIPKRLPRLPERQPIPAAKEERRPLTLPERVNQAIDRGVAYLKARHAEHNQYRNYLGLLGLTLLECGSAAERPSIQQIAAWIRAREIDITQTYELTLAILFLDRLGEERDHTLIRSFGQRLLSGQLECGAWTYSCLMNDRPRPVVKRPDDLPIILSPRHGPNQLRSRGERQRIVYRGDNSNTQFALLGLWVGQRHGVPARSAFLAADRYFRATQLSDGSWNYQPNHPRWRDSMTCAGLMSLAMRYGAGGQGGDLRSQQPIQVHDAAITRGLRFLAQAPDKITLINGRIIGVDARYPLYFLWSLERMAVIYDLQKIGEREWYPWAAELLVRAQSPDGRWPDSDPAATCFALLILKRSNFAKDLRLAVKEPPSRPPPIFVGPTILQGPDAVPVQIGKPQRPTSLPGAAVSPRPLPQLGPSISRTPKTK